MHGLDLPPDRTMPRHMGLATQSIAIGGGDVPNDQPTPFLGPLYEQVHHVLRARILAGEWEPKVPLPGETWLSKELGVSIGTVRKAMDQLTRENLVFRERGRGTFVRADARASSSSGLRLCDRHGTVITPTIEVVEHSVSPASEREIADLQIRPYLRSPMVLRIHRLWQGPGSLLGHETITVDQARFPGLLQAMDDATQTLFPVYASHFKCCPKHLRWTIGACGGGPSPDADRAGRTGASALVICRLAMDARSVPLELSELHIVDPHCSVQIVG